MLTPMEVGSFDSTGKLFHDFQQVVVGVNDRLDKLRDEITKKRDSFKQQNMLQTTFGATDDSEKTQQMKKWQIDQVKNCMEESRAKQSVPLDDVLCLIKAMAHLKTQNMELQVALMKAEAQLDSYQQLEQMPDAQLSPREV